MYSIHDDWEIISFSEARDKGYKYWFTGELCKRGHIAPILMSSGTCSDCGRENAREYYRRARLDIQDKNNIKNYGISNEDVARLAILQNNKCAICNNEFIKTPHLDHCHKTKKIRKLLCSKCNTGLGLFNDNPELMQKAIGYLNDHS